MITTTRITVQSVKARMARLRRPGMVAANAALLLTVAGVGTAAGHPVTQRAAAARACTSTRTAGATRIGRFAGIVRPVRLSAACSAVIGDPHTSGGTPPLINHGGPMMSTPATADKVVVTPIYWAGAGYSFPAAYKTLLNQYLRDSATDSEKVTNVFSTLFEYGGSNGKINYRFQLATPISDSTAFPAAGCTTSPGPVYADNSGYTTCLDDAQVQSETNAVLAARGLTRNLGHMYIMFLPKHVESCFFAGNPSNQACTINATPSAAYCAYHSEFGGNTVYANMPFPIYQSATLFSCTDENLGGPTSTIQSPNGSVDADVEVSPLSHEMSESITDPDTNTGWYDSSGFENGDECAYIYGTLSGSNGGFYNQTINGHHYLTQDEFSNADFAKTGGGCLQHFQPVKPTVTGLSSHAGSHTGGATVTIRGTGFAGATTVHFGTTVATFTLIDSTKIRVITPAHAAGTVDVTVQTSAGTSTVISADHYTFS